MNLFFLFNQWQWRTPRWRFGNEIDDTQIESRDSCHGRVSNVVDQKKKRYYTKTLIHFVLYSTQMHVWNDKVHHSWPYWYSLKYFRPTHISFGSCLSLAVRSTYEENLLTSNSKHAQNSSTALGLINHMLAKPRTKLATEAIYKTGACFVLLLWMAMAIVTPMSRGYHDQLTQYTFVNCRDMSPIVCLMGVYDIFLQHLRRLNVTGDESKVRGLIIDFKLISHACVSVCFHFRNDRECR